MCKCKLLYFINELNFCADARLNPLKVKVYDQLSQKRTPLRPVLTVRLREVERCPAYASQDIVTPVIQLKLNLSATSTRLFNLHKTAYTGTV